MGDAPRRDAEERDLELVTDALRRLKDKPTERALRRLAKAALGGAPDAPRPAEPDRPA